MAAVKEPGRPAAASLPTAQSVSASWTSVEALPVPLGATWIAEEDAWSFAVYSERAERVTLLLYSEGDPASPLFTRELDHLQNKSGPVWHSLCRSTFLAR